jgi:hypothetical protein
MCEFLQRHKDGDPATDMALLSSPPPEPFSSSSTSDGGDGSGGSGSCGSAAVGGGGEGGGSGVENSAPPPFDTPPPSPPLLPKPLSECHVLELGAGVGLVGLFAASMGCKSMTVTDMEEVKCKL